MANSYTVLGPLGRGNYGEVVLAEKAGMRYAIKKFNPRFYDGVETPQEVSLLLQASHPHIIKAKESFFLNDRQYLVMELAQVNLEDYIKFNKPKEDRVLPFLSQLTSALVYLQDNGFSHCDIKPNNVLLQVTQGVAKVKLADMGLSCYKSAQPDCCQTYSSPQNYYTNNDLHGVIHEKYTKIFKQRVDYQASDIWALGVTFVYMLTGKILFYADQNSILGEMYKFIDDPNLYLIDIVPTKWLNLIGGMLNPDQNKRIKLAREVAKFLPPLELDVEPTPIFYQLPSGKEEEFMRELGVKMGVYSLVHRAALACYQEVFSEGDNQKCLFCACIFLLTKAYESRHLFVDDLIYFTDKTFTEKQLYQMEERVFNKLQGKVFFSLV